MFSSFTKTPCFTKHLRWLLLEIEEKGFDQQNVVEKENNFL